MKERKHPKMSKVNLYFVKTDKVEKIDFPGILVEKENLELLAQAVRVYFDQTHIGHVIVKTRGEVDRTTKKWYKQKGTGNARHGARSAPIFVGGGKAHGPRGLKRVLVLPKKMTIKARKVALGMKVSANEVSVIEGLSDIKKTKDAQLALGRIFGSKQRVTLVLGKDYLELTRFLRNIPNLRLLSFNSLNAFNIYFGGRIIFDTRLIEKTLEKKGKTKK